MVIYMGNSFSLNYTIRTSRYFYFLKMNYTATHSTSASTKESKLLITFVNTKNTRTRQEISAEVSVWQSSGTTQLYGQSHLRHLPAVWY